jgi:hypothetical protein
LRQCTNTASTPQAVAACATTALPAQQKGFTDCAATSAKNVAMCFDKISRYRLRLRRVIRQCRNVRKVRRRRAHRGQVDKLRRLGQLGLCARPKHRDVREPEQGGVCCSVRGGDGAAFAACMAGGNDKLETYLAAANPALADAQKTFSCVSKILRRHAGLRLLGASTWRRRFAYSRLRRESRQGCRRIVLARGQARSSRGPARLQMHREWKLRQQPHRKLLGRHS